MLKYWLLGSMSAALAFALTPLVAKWAIHLGAVDEPNERRMHTGRIPCLGGLMVGLIVDHFGLLEVAPRALDLSRAAGIGVMLVGVYLIMR